MGKTSVKFSGVKKLPVMPGKRIAEMILPAPEGGVWTRLPIEAFRGTGFSGSPELTAADWRKTRPAYTKIPKTDIHTKTDAAILDWLKRDGKGHRARLNAALRFAMNNGF
jgi:uncharacterized protein (DUF4415 family)